MTLSVAAQLLALLEGTGRKAELWRERKGVKRSCVWLAEWHEQVLQTPADPARVCVSKPLLYLVLFFMDDIQAVDVETPF